MLAGTLATWRVARREDAHMRDDILTEARMVANAVNWNLVDNLTASDRDLDSPDYRRLKERLSMVRSANPRYRFIYLMGEWPGKGVFFFVDSEPPTSPDYSPPGQRYPEAQKILLDVFSRGEEAVEGPVSDRWGTWVSALVPLLDPETGKVTAVLGMDIGAGPWQAEIREACVLPIAITLLIVALLGGFYMVRRGADQARFNFEIFFNSVEDFLFVLDCDGRIQHVNETVVRRLGYHREELRRRGLGSLCPSIPPGADDAALARTMIEEKSPSSLRHLESRDGRVIPVETTATPGLWNNRPACFVVCKDFSLLQQSEDRFARAFNSSAVLMAVSSLQDGRFLDVNEMFCSTLEYSRSEIIGQSYERLGIFAEESAYAGLLQALKEGSPPRNEEVEVRTKGGAVRQALLSADMIEIADQHCVLMVLTDISKRKRAEEELLAAYERSQRQQDVVARLSVSPHLASGKVRELSLQLTELAAEAVGVARAGVWLFDDMEEELMCLDLYESKIGRHSAGMVLTRREYRDEFEALSRSKYLDADDALRDPRTAGYVESYLKPLQITSMLDAVIRASGRNLGVLCLEHVRQPHRWTPDEVTFACQLADQVALSIVNQERNLAEEERLEMERRFFHVQKLESLGVMAGGIAHDFNNLLAAIMGNLELGLRDLEPESPLRPRLQAAVEAVKRATNLTRQMLAYSGGGKVFPSPLNLNELVTGNMEMLRRAVPAGVEIDCRLGGGLSPILGDSGQVHQVLVNLLTNAAEAIGAGPGTIRLGTGEMDCDGTYLRSSRLTEKPLPGKFVWLEVADTGCGMDDDTLQRLFDPFFTRKFTGRGLGMAAVLGIVRGHHGAIFVESRAGAGTTVRVLFPAAPEEAGKSRIPAAPAVAGEVLPETLPGTALVVDDEAIVLEVCAAFLEKLGMKAVTVSGGREALERFRRSPDGFDCVILDLTMPGMDGFATFEALRSLDPGVKVVLCSGYNEAEATERFQGMGLAGFLHKPYELEELRAILAAALVSPS